MPISDNKISVVINTYNASLYLEQVLDSLAEFDEIVICDMESTDATVSIAEKHGCRIVTFKKGNTTICEPARNTAIRAASNKWVLVVDADEIVTPQLRAYLYKRLNEGNCPEGLYVPRRNMFLGHYVHSSPDYQLRFFQRDKADWPPIIHRPPRIEGKIGKIPHGIKGVHLLHLDDACLYDRVSKHNLYTNHEISKRMSKRYGFVTMLFRPLWSFIRCYFIQGAIRDGMRGLIRSYMSAWYQVLLLSKIKENQWNNEKDKIKAKR